MKLKFNTAALPAPMIRQKEAMGTRISPEMPKLLPKKNSKNAARYEIIEVKKINFLNFRFFMFSSPKY